MLFWKHIRGYCTFKENIFNSIDNKGHINLSNFMTIINSYKHFPNFPISKQLNSNMSRTARFHLLSLALFLLWTLRGLMLLLTIDMIAYISRSQLGLRLAFLWFFLLEKLPLVLPLEEDFTNRANYLAFCFFSVSSILCSLFIQS